jgi:hypothetical protein
VLDLTIINNSKRDLEGSLGSPIISSAKKVRNQGEQEKKETMRFMFWNIRGFGNAARWRQIREYIREEKLDAIGL